jgi:hypothetical protein
MKLNKHYRQGDVLIERIESIPATAKKQKQSKSIILAHGEVTGHHHRMEVADPADWWKEGEIVPTLEKPSVLAGEIFVSLATGGCVTHDEHSTIELPSGNYRISRQREYHPQAIRNVQD